MWPAVHGAVWTTQRKQDNDAGEEDEDGDEDGGDEVIAKRAKRILVYPVRLCDVVLGSHGVSMQSGKKGQKGAGKGKPKLNRPIICICNDLWAPNLKLLRESGEAL